ncbi:protein-disulfide reductase DsbD [Alteromonas halophila]|uniref:Thiol:disulfide interchange protein DsbD n=1 Tax=Alteromonas halophila TaxID=516698 RepID=A0A918N0M5_9ALTE|nr:protein-disulfide reductase DsbD [Alteromonas halophila]GGW90509.1 thiol:disulfide interchange protein DsbD [Alteromonas halophila]
MKHLLLLVLLSLTVAFTPQLAHAQFNDDGMDDVFGGEEQTFLKVDEAFEFDFNQQDDTLVIRFAIADGYYLYKKQFKFVSDSAELGNAAFPKGKMIEDEFFGTSEVFFEDLTIRLPVSKATEDALVKVRYQGCAEAGLCYPPTVKQVYLSEVGTASSQTGNATQSEQFSLADRLSSSDSVAITLLLFLVLGIGLAFTPCVFPMYPIISGIVIGQGKDIKLSRALSLSFIYVQGMAITYSLLGLIVASAGVQFQAALQHPVILGVFIVAFVLLAIAMFGAYEIQLPAAWQQRLNNLSNDQTRGSFVGVFIMGVLSGLVASPCTTAPLTGILLFIAQTGDMVFGFIALYVLSIGMGIPLVLFAVTGGKLLPKAGNWMNIVKVTFGFMMLAVALIFVERLWSSDYVNLFYAALGLAAFTYYQVMNQGSAASLGKGVRSLVIFIGLFTSAMVGYQTLFSDSSLTQSSSTSSAGQAHPEFVVVKNLEDFEAKLADANAQGKSVMVDLYADWCVACKEFEKYTFPDAAVVEALDNTVWMQIDLTENTPTNLAFQDEFDVLGLPTILFFNKNGTEVPQSRVTGFMKAAPFARHVEQVLPE